MRMVCFSIGQVPRLMESVNQCVMVFVLIICVKDSSLRGVPRPAKDQAEQSGELIGLF